MLNAAATNRGGRFFVTRILPTLFPRPGGQEHPLQLTGGNAERMALALDDADRAGRRWPRRGLVADAQMHTRIARGTPAAAGSAARD